MKSLKYIPVVLIAAVAVFHCSRQKNPYESPDYNTPPMAAFTVQPLTGDTGTVFNVDASKCSDTEDGTDVLEVRWDWTHDGTWDKDWTTTKTDGHKYTSEGTHAIKLQVRDSNGDTDTLIREVVINNGRNNTPPTAFFTVTPESGSYLSAFVFDASGCTDAEDQSALLTVTWDFDGDGSWDTTWSLDKNMSHRYAAAGVYPVTLKVRDTGELTASMSMVITVTSPLGTITDTRDGQHYATVAIGTQTWMAQNLNYGTPLNSVQIQTDNGTAEKYYRDFDPGNADPYGGYYCWDEAMQYTTAEGAQGVCPSGWHIPSDGEWKTLETVLGMTPGEVDLTGGRGRDQMVGSQLKAGGTSGFGALMGGYGMPGVGADTTAFEIPPRFYNYNFTGDFWSSSQDSAKAWIRELEKSDTDINRVSFNKKNYVCVRCIKN